MDVTASGPAKALGARSDGLESPQQRSAAISGIAMSAFIGLVALLHWIKPEFDPSWRFLSEYSIGRHGWVMMTAFFIWAISCFSLSMALRDQVRTRAGRVGCALLVVVGLSLIMAGLFAQDPITAKPSELTTHGRLHAVASMIGIPGVPIAALLITWSLTRHNAAWLREGRGLMALAHLTWFSLLVMAIYLTTAVPRAGGFGPDVLAGWMNRLVVITYGTWQMAASYAAYRVDVGNRP